MPLVKFVKRGESVRKQRPPNVTREAEVEFASAW